MFIGIDTSNYTTSLAAYDGETMTSLKQLLKVPLGKIGLRQSECVFCHMQTLGDMFQKMEGLGRLQNIEAIGVSDCPRRMEGSYMPVFMAGVQTARSVSATLHVPLYTFSHQEGHIMAALFSSQDDFWKNGEPFLFLHLSGGTTEFLKCCYQKDGGFSSEILGGTSDISAGQLIDRVGVKMGLPFPSGRYIEEFSKKATEPYELPVNVSGNCLSFSGCEAEVFRIIERENIDLANLSKSLLMAVTKALVGVFSCLLEKLFVNHIVIAGGVASCDFVREELAKYLADCGKQVLFAQREYSSDNAAGIAALAMQRSEDNGR